MTENTENHEDEIKELDASQVEILNRARADIKAAAEPLRRAQEILSENHKAAAELLRMAQEISSENLKASLEPLRRAHEFRENFREILKAFAKQVEEKNEEAIKIRGEVVTAIIDLDDILEEVLLKKYIKEELRDEFRKNMLNDESFSSHLKYKVVKGSGLLDEYDKKNNLKKGEKRLATQINELLTWRNIFAHCKHDFAESSFDIELAYKLNGKDKVSDIKELKINFDFLYKDTMSKLEDILKNLEETANNS